MTSATTDQEAHAAMVAEIKEKFPEAWEFILDLYSQRGPDGDDDRLIDGTRAIFRFGPIRNLDGPNVVSVAEMVLESKEDKPLFPTDKHWA